MSAQPTSEVPQERLRFRELILGNPNYFGTGGEVELPPVVELSSQTTYEELTCVGLQPGLDQLEAVVQVKLNTGYDGPLCSGGSVEYVRFYLSQDGGTTWTDEGLASFAVYDTPGPRPLAYAVDLHAAISHRLCFLTNEPLVRAILSWNQAPPPATPGFTPVWGNVVEVSVAPSAAYFIVLEELLDEAKLAIPKQLKDVIDLGTQVKAAKPASTSLADLHRGYEGSVPATRYVFPYLSQQLAAGDATVAPPQAAQPVSQLAELGINLTAMIAKLAEVDGDTYYEHLDCVGYDPGTDALTGVLTIEQPAGYGGGACTAGSQEYVAFWIDWGSGWTYAGTASVPVHDYPVPAGGLKFAVYQPIASSAHRQNCGDGPVQPAVRATLSWATPPPPGNPDWVPTWGNQLDVVIQLAPGAVQLYQPVVEAISDVAVCEIDQVNGLTLPPYYQPFGGVLTVSGFIPGAPFRPLPGLSYRVSVRPAGSLVWQPLVNTFDVAVTQYPGAQTVVPQTPDGQGFYPYLEDDNPSNWRRVVDDVLGVWITAQPMTGLWEILVESRDPNGNIYPAQVISCGNGQAVGPAVTVCLDEIAPATTLDIVEFVRNGVTHPAAGCMKFQQGDLLIGTYSATDLHFRFLELILDPPSLLGVTPSPSQVLPVAPSTGVSGTWQLDTTNLDPCGYVVRLRAWDATIVSGSAIGWESAELAVGFCIQ
jgi:hypothetical protein